MRYKTAELRFYGDLIDFLPDGKPVVERTFDVSPSVKDTIEACGVPHPEVDLVLVDGEPVGWEHAVVDGERIAVYPRFRAFDIAGLSAVHVPPLPEVRFLVDVHLGTLTRYLRLLGFDAIQPDADDGELADLSVREARNLLTRDLGLLKRTVVRHGYFVRSSDPLMQAVEVVRYFDLDEDVSPFTRCMECNGRIVPVATADAVDRVPPGVRRNHDRFRECAECGRLYWEGTHFGRLEEIVASVRVLARRRR
jgi:uncharacterized protein with PIN domain